ncbi:MAG: T9SS type A sorting domain-containing protein [Salinivirgaceae bacterium]|jgi:hypothetical protein|nr:T9SS type A sorting domain-containing protein [Salinivirgaceae bacterium]
MKNLSLLLIFVACALFATAQTGFAPQVVSKSLETNSKTTKVQTPTKAPGDVLWEHDFNGELWSGTSEDGFPVPSNAPDGWQLTDATGNGFYWRWDTIGPRGALIAPCPEPRDEVLESPTSSNGFMMLELDYFNTTGDCTPMENVTNLDATVTYNAGLDFSAVSSVHMYITQWNIFCCGDYGSDIGAFFDVSTDGGTTWESMHIEDNEGLNEWNSNTGEASKFDVSNLVGGQADVQFRFRLTGEAHYVWCFDDVQFVEPYEHDIALVDYWNNYISENLDEEDQPSYTHEDETDFVEGFYYYPWFMTQYFKSYDLEIKNNGSMSQTNIEHNVEVMRNGALHTSFTSDPYVELAPSTVDTIKTEGEFMPRRKGHYQVLHTTIADNSDQNFTNDSLSRDFVVTTDFLSPVQYNKSTRRIAPSDWNNYVEGRGLGFSFELPEPGEFHGDGTADWYLFEGIEVYIPDQTNDQGVQLIENGNATLTAELYRWDEANEEYFLIINSDTYVVNISDTSTMVSIPFALDGSSEYVTEGGEYVVCLAQYGTWEDDLLGRTQTFDIGGTREQKIAFGAGVLVDPGATKVGPADAGPCIAVKMAFSDPYPETEYNVKVNVTDNGAIVEDASVTINGVETHTNATGATTLLLEDGSYPYVIEKDDQIAEGTFAISGSDREITLDFNSIFTVNTVDFDVYPNPSNGVFNLNVDGNAKVTILNVAGQVVESFTTTGSKTVNLDNVNAGVYFVRVRVDNQVGTKQLIIR